MGSPDLLDLDATATLAAMESSVLGVRRREVDQLLLAVHWADLHADDPQARPGAVPVSRGGDRLVDIGGEGTPLASEFCWSELAIAREAGVIATKNFAADALDLRHRLPLLWAAVLDLQLPVWVARKVAAMSRKLTRAQCEIVDAAVAAAVEESPPRILEIAEAKVIEADLEAHRARLAADAAQVGVCVSRPRPGQSVDEIDGEPSTRRVTLKLPAGAALDFDDKVDEIADLLLAHSAPDPEDPDREPTRGELEVKAVELLTNPHAAAAFLDQINNPGPAPPEGEDVPPPLPAPTRRPAVIYLHLSDLVLNGVPGVVRVEGMGPMVLEQLTELLKNRDITVHPVIDLNDGHSVNGYEHPTLVKERTLLRTLGEVFPHTTSRTARRLDHDHPTPYDPLGPPGQTGDHNDAPLTRSHHRAKTHTGYELKQMGLATYRWITPHGLGRLVTRQGTRRFDPIRATNGNSIGEIYYSRLLT